LMIGFKQRRTHAATLGTVAVLAGGILLLAAATAKLPKIARH
jgi:hypothetical protein